MVKNKGFANNSKLKKPYFPLVSVCTPTFNRRPFIPIMLDCFRNQDYPKDRMEWIIVDDGTDPIRDLIELADIPQIKYVHSPKRMNLGEKRNYMHTLTKGSIIVYMDDDDYYPPERVSHAVDTLMKHPEALCAGSSELYVYFKHIQKMVQCGPYGPNHATAGTFAFRSTLLKETRYVDSAALAEERAFLKDYTVPFVQLDPLKTILVFSHIHNTFDKKRMLENPHPDFLKESPKTIQMFIKNDFETHIRDFFIRDIDKLLEMYAPGHPKMKPEVLEQTRLIEEERQQRMSQAVSSTSPNSTNLNNENITIMMKEEGKEPTPMTMKQIVELLQKQEIDNATYKKENASLKRRLADLEETIEQLQRLSLKNAVLPAGSVPFSKAMFSAPATIDNAKLKSEPEVNIRA